MSPFRARHTATVLSMKSRNAGITGNAVGEFELLGEGSSEGTQPSRARSWVTAEVRTWSSFGLRSKTSRRAIRTSKGRTTWRLDVYVKKDQAEID